MKFNTICTNRNWTLLKNDKHESSDQLNKKNLERNLHSYSQKETKYKQNISKIGRKINKRQELMLPIKTKDGFIKKNTKNLKQIKNLNVIKPKNKIHDKCIINFSTFQVKKTDKLTESITTVHLLGSRKERLKSVRYKIGILATDSLEYPEKMLKNFSILLNYMEEKDPEIYISARKLATASLLEIFKDCIPSYSIRLINKDQIKLKKETLHLQNYESSILKYYKEYLKKLENMAGSIKNKKYSLNPKEESFYLGTLAIICMTNLLVNQPYFNFSSNIAKFLVPYLDSKYQNIRHIISQCFMQIFKNDKQGKISLCIVRNLFQYIKKQRNLVYSEKISILLSLPLQHIISSTEKKNKLKDRTKYIEINTYKQNQQNNFKVSIEIINCVLKIYFYIFNLNKFENAKIFSFSLEGLLKYSGYISSHFQKDLVNVLYILLAKNCLSFTDQFRCIYAIVIISSYQSTVLNIDFTKLFMHLYTILVDIYIGKNIKISILIKILEQILTNKYKNITSNRLLAFIKRICGITLNFEHNSALAIFSVIKKTLYNCKIASILLDTDSNIGNGIYLPEMTDPDYCNAQCTSLWEIVALQRHYHIVLKNLSKKIVSDIEVEQKSRIKMEVFKSTSESKYYLYDSSKGLFKPSIPIPKELHTKNCRYNNLLTHKINLQDQNIYKINFNIKDSVDFFYDLKKNPILMNCNLNNCTKSNGCT